MQLQGLPVGNRTRVLWITRPVLYHWATEAALTKSGETVGTRLQKPLPTTWAQVQYMQYIGSYNVYLNDTQISYTLLWFSSIDNECKCQILLLIHPYTSPALPSHQYINVFQAIRNRAIQCDIDKQDSFAEGTERSTSEKRRYDNARLPIKVFQKRK